MRASSGTTCWWSRNDAEENVNWQYRTILFEYQKDGLLGDKYIDDEEMEKILNEQGEQGWELVSVTSVQEGLLAFFKKVLLPARKQPAGEDARGGEAVRSPVPQPPATAGQKGEKRKEGGPGAAESPIGPSAKKDKIGQIRIS